jgi:hypothetical protein
MTIVIYMLGIEIYMKLLDEIELLYDYFSRSFMDARGRPVLLKYQVGGDELTMALASPTWNYMKRFLDEACTIPLASIFIHVCYIFFLWVIPAPSMHLAISEIRTCRLACKQDK